MSRRYDVVVIGAGIHGAGVAQAAAVAGYRVLVLERTAIAAGTSSRSSKLIHGGLRYLESGQWSLVRASLRERALLLRLAPDLVRAVPFHIPIYHTTRRGALTVRLGLSVYALLGGLATTARFSSVARMNWDRLDGLRTHGLRAVFRYYDAQTDDAALTRAVMRSAQQFGAELACPAEFVSAGRATDGYTVRYHTDTEHEIEATVLVNAGGPWVEHVAQRVTPAPPRFAVDLVQGTHVVMPGALSHGCYYTEAPQDGRAVFALPWHGHTLVGTTETLYTGDPAAVQPHPQEVDYLLAVLRHYFPRYTDAPLQRFAGLRVLPRAAAAAFDRPRDTVFALDCRPGVGYAAIYGGKLTAYRATAAKLMHHIYAALPSRSPRGDTARLPLTPE